MNFLYAVFFGAGVAAFVYSKMSRRIGYGNTQNQLVVVATIFVIATIVFFTLLQFILGI